MKNLAITGPTSGIGIETVKKLVPIFDRIFLLARDGDKVDTMIRSFGEKEQKKFTFVPLDLADLSSVRNAANTIISSTDSLDVLINNAGGIFDKKGLTNDGFELTFSTNHLGHYLLTNLLMSVLLKNQGSKVIHVSSEAHRMAKVNFDDLNFKVGFSSFKTYANAKLFNILFTKSLAEKFGHHGLKAYALHPGVVKTNFAKESTGLFGLLWKLGSPFMITAAEGAKTSIYLAATEKPESQNGGYFKKEKEIKPSKAAMSKRMRDNLWQYSEDLVKPWLDKH